MFTSDVELYNEANTLKEKAYHKYVKYENLDSLFKAESSGITLLSPKDDAAHQNYYTALLDWLMTVQKEPNQQDISIKGGKLLQSMYVDGWEYSADREYLTKLFNNITRYEDFNVNGTNSIILRSFAAFVQRGLGEWEKLKDYLDERASEIPDRRYIYGLYGSMLGFSTMSKTLTDTTSIPNDVLAKFLFDLNKFANNDIEVAFVATETHLHGNNFSNSENFFTGLSQSWKQQAEKYIRNKASNKKNRDAALEVLHDVSILTPEKFYSCLKQKKGWTRGVVLNGLKDLLLLQDKETNAQNKEIDMYNQHSLFSLPDAEQSAFSNADSLKMSTIHGTTCSISFEYKNIDIILSKIKERLPLLSDKVVNCLKSDLVWVLDPKFSKNTTPNESIEKFRKQLEDGLTLRRSRNGKDMTWKNRLYKELDIDKLINYLHDLYDNR